MANLYFRLAKDLASVAKGSVEMRVERKVKAIQVCGRQLLDLAPGLLVDIISPTIIPDTFCHRKRTGRGAAALWLGRDADPQEPAPAEGAL